MRRWSLEQERREMSSAREKDRRRCERRRKRERTELNVGSLSLRRNSKKSVVGQRDGKLNSVDLVLRFRVERSDGLRRKSRRRESAISVQFLRRVCNSRDPSREGWKLTETHLLKLSDITQHLEPEHRSISPPIEVRFPKLHDGFRQIPQPVLLPSDLGIVLPYKAQLEPEPILGLGGDGDGLPDIDSSEETVESVLEGIA